LTIARNAQKEFLIGQSSRHTRHIADHLWMASSFVTVVLLNTISTFQRSRQLRLRMNE